MSLGWIAPRPELAGWNSWTAGIREELLARPAAPPYRGEGPFGLWHFSEDRSLRRFRPHRPATHTSSPPLVWAVDTRHAPLFWFPRNGPRGCTRPVPTTTPADRERFFGQTEAPRIHIVEASWLERIRRCRLHAYRLSIDAFRPHHQVGGYSISDRSVDASERVDHHDLLALHAAAGVELRLAPAIRPFWDRVVTSSVGFSGLRLRNATA